MQMLLQVRRVRELLHSGQTRTMSGLYKSKMRYEPIKTYKVFFVALKGGGREWN